MTPISDDGPKATFAFMFQKLATALLPTLIRWWELLRTPVAQGWKKRSRVRRDAAEGSNGGAEGSAWDALLEMENQGAFFLVVDLAAAFGVKMTVMGLFS